MIKDLFEEKKPLFSFEVFPPKKDDDFPAVFDVLQSLKALSPDFISVTYGAGGGNSKKTVEVASYIQKECGIQALAHVTSVGFLKKDLDDAGQELSANGVCNVLALRGDRPKTMSDEQYERREFLHASDMISHLKESSGLCIAGACYPEKHFEAASMQEDLNALKIKENAGADFFISQLFFDNDCFYAFRDKARAIGVTKPLCPGIMPITSAKQLGTTVNLSGSSIPKKLSDLIAKYGDNAADMRKAGIDYAIGQIQDLLHYQMDGIHIYTMNKPEIAREIIEAVR